MSSESNITWLSVLEDKRKELASLSQQGYRIHQDPVDRRALRLGLEQLCRKNPDRYQLVYKYFDADSHIIDLARRVAGSASSLQNQPHDEGLESLICQLALVILEVSFTSEW